MKKIQSTCNLCALDCNFDFYVEDDKIVKVMPTKGYPVNDGFSCIKGLSLDRQQSRFHANPLPRVKTKDGTMEHKSWEETFQLVADRLLAIKERYGGDSIAGISTGQLPLEEMALFGHVMRNFLKGHVDGNTRLCMATSVVAHKQSFGFDAPGFTLQDVELSDTIIFIGSNPVVAHPVFWGRAKSNKNAKIIVIDPRVSETAKNADYHFQIECKSDLVLFYTVANLLIEKGWVDEAYIANSTEGYEEFREFVKDFTLERAVKVTGLFEEEILKLVELIHEGKRVSFWWTMGINQGYEAVRTAQAIINLALMTGNIGRPGTGANSITGQSNAMGSRAFSNTAGLYGGGDFDNPVRRQRIAQVLEIPEDMIATKPTLPYNAIIEKINSGEIKALWVLSTNPRHSWINNETFQSAMEKLELFIVQDLYEDTDSSNDCDIFLPVVPGIKKDGTFINLERRVSALRQVISRGENELSDYEVFLGVGKALGMGDALRKWATPKMALELMKGCSKGMPCDITGITWEDLEESNGIQWPFPEGATLSSDQRRLFEDGMYYTPSKKAKFIFEEPMKNPLPTTEEFPYIFNTGRGTVGQWHTQVRSREISFTNDATLKEAYVFVNDQLAKEKGIVDGDHIRIHSINGHDARFFVKVTEDMPYDQIYAPIHYVECNKLTASIYDPYSKEPSYKATPVTFEKE